MEEMNVTDALVSYVKENQTRKILEIVEKSKTKEEAEEKIKALLNQ